MGRYRQERRHRDADRADRGCRKARPCPHVEGLYLSLTGARSVFATSAPPPDDGPQFGESAGDVPFAAAAGSALLSRTPLRDRDIIDDTAFKNLRGVTDLPGARATRVLAIHPAAPTGDGRDWVHDTDTIKAYLHELGDGPVIAAGDYNATWDQARFRGFLRHGFADAGEQSGSGFLPTYPTNGRLGNRPVVAIDHVVIKGFVATSVRTHFVKGSDHRAIVVKLVAA